MSKDSSEPGGTPNKAPDPGPALATSAELDRPIWDDRAAAAAAATAVPGAVGGATYGRDHSLAVGRGKRIGTLVSGCALLLIGIAFAVAMMSQGGDADLRPSAAAKSPGVLQSSGASVRQDVRSADGGKPAQGTSGPSN